MVLPAEPHSGPDSANHPDHIDFKFKSEMESLPIPHLDPEFFSSDNCMASAAVTSDEFMSDLGFGFGPDDNCDFELTFDDLDKLYLPSVTKDFLLPDGLNPGAAESNSGSPESGSSAIMVSGDDKGGLDVSRFLNCPASSNECSENSGGLASSQGSGISEAVDSHSGNSCNSVTVSSHAICSSDDEKVKLEDWETMLSETAASPAHDQSLLRWIAGDVDDMSCGLKQLLQSGKGNHQQQEIDEALQREIRAAFRTDEIRRTAPTPQDEIRAGMSYFHETIWKGVPKFLRRVDTALKNIGKERDSKRALRMSNQDVSSAVDFLVEQKAKRAQKREEDIQQGNEITEQKKYGTTPLKKAVDIKKLNQSVSIGFDKELAAESLRRNENDAEKALDDLTNPEVNSSIQVYIESKKRKRQRQAIDSSTESLVGMGFERSRVIEAFQTAGDGATLEQALHRLLAGNATDPTNATNNQSQAISTAAADNNIPADVANDIVNSLVSRLDNADQNGEAGGP
ncbi:hypothetical protein ACFX2I_015004 [Malus domestica]